jgi:hypothetical protein
MKAFRTILLAFGLLLGMHAGLRAQNSGEGVRSVETRDHVTTYQIKIKGLASAAQATLLDETMGSKEGVISSSTNSETHVCEVRVKEGFDSALFHDIVEASGMMVAKSFED